MNCLRDCPRIAAINERIANLENGIQALSEGEAEVEKSELDAIGLTVTAEVAWEQGKITHEEYVAATGVARYLLDDATDRDDPSSFASAVERSKQVSGLARQLLRLETQQRDFLIANCSRLSERTIFTRRPKKGVCRFDQ